MSAIINTEFSIPTIFKGHLKQFFIESLSGVVNGLLMFVFCFVFAQLIFGQSFDGDVTLFQFVPVGAACNMISVFVVGWSYAVYSDCPLSIAGPDVNPTVFLAQIAVHIGNDIHNQFPDMDVNSVEYEQMMVSSILLSFIFCTGIIGVWFYILGRFHLTQVLQFVPAAVLCGFLAAIGVIILLKAVKQAVGTELYHHPGMWQFWALLAPAIPIGVFLYFSKRYHMGSPIVTIPLMLFGPFILFYVIVYATGQTIESLRSPESDLCAGSSANISCFWVFPSYAQDVVTNQWNFSYGLLNYVQWMSLLRSTPILVVMIIVVTLDVLLKMSGTKKALKLQKMDYDHEMMLCGRANILLIGLVGVPAYAQLKFNMLNFGIIDNVTSRYPGWFSAFFNAALLFSAWPMINYLPRFFVGGLLIYACAGFLVENLIDTWIQNQLTTFEYLIVIAIVVISQVGGDNGMLIAVAVGVVISALYFAFQYGRSGVIKSVTSARDFQSSVTRSDQEERKVEHLCKQCLIIRLHRHIFFGSASQVMDLVDDILVRKKSELYLPGVDSDRISLIVFDFEDVERIDFSGVTALSELITALVTAPVVPPPGSGMRTPQGSRISAASDRSLKNQPEYEPEFKKPNWCSKMLTKVIKFVSRRTDFKVYKRYRVMFSGMDNKTHMMFFKSGVLDLLHEPNEYGIQPKLIYPEMYSRIRDLTNKCCRSGKKKQEAELATSLPRTLSGVSMPSTELEVDTRIFYENADIRLREQRIFHNLDFALECVEEILLEDACRIRSKWLSFSSAFHRLHEQSRLKVQHEPFEHLLRGHLGDTIWKYLDTVRVSKGVYLCRSGEVNPNLYLLQKGRLSSYIHREDGLDIRVQTLRRGAFVNEDALFIEVPVVHSIVADEDCVLLALSRDSLKDLEMHQPDVGFEIHRNILKHIARTRNKLTRELDATATSRFNNSRRRAATMSERNSESMSSMKQLNRSSSQWKPGQAHLSSVTRKMGAAIETLAQEKDDHEELQMVAEENPKDFSNMRRISRTPSPSLGGHSPKKHLYGGRSMDRQRAQSDAVPLYAMSEDTTGRRSRKFSSLMFRSDIFYPRKLEVPTLEDPTLTADQMEVVRANLILPVSMKKDAIRRFREALKELHDGDENVPLISGPPSMFAGSATQTITKPSDLMSMRNVGALFQNDLDEAFVFKILMDVGLFPAREELQAILTSLNVASYENISEEIFLEVLRKLSIGELTDSQISAFAKLFQQHAVTLPDEMRNKYLFYMFHERVILLSGLSEMLKDLNLQEDRLTVERYLREWQRVPSTPIMVGEELGLSFMSFCSMMAKHMMDDKLDQEVEAEFLRISSSGEMLTEDIVLSKGYITVENLLNALPGMISVAQAREMIFEADIDEKGVVSYLDLLETLTTVFDSEIESKPMLDMSFHETRFGRSRSDNDYSGTTENVFV